MTNGTFNPAALAGTVYGIAGAGISLGLLAGMARGISDMTWGHTSTVRRDRRVPYQKPRKKAKAAYNPYGYTPKYTWR